MQFEIRKKDPPRVAKFQAIIVLTNAPCSSRFYVFLQLITDGSPNKHQKKTRGGREEDASGYLQKNNTSIIFGSEL